MTNILVLQITGFVVCFILLFYLTAKYRAALVAEATVEYPVEDLTVMTVTEPKVAPRAEVLGALKNASALELADLKEQVKELYYRLEEQKLTQGKQVADLNKMVSRLEQRLTTFEQEYVHKLQPTLLSLIEELESMKVGGKQGK